MLNNLRPAIVSVAFFTVLSGLAYPLAVTGVAQALFRSQADGELVKDASGQIIGSHLIGQGFARPGYLHQRPSAAGTGYDASSSSGSNMGPLSQKLADRMTGDAALIRRLSPTAVIPADAVTTSGSGLDPDISPEYAHLQAARVAAERHTTSETIEQIIRSKTTPAFLGFIGQPRVNVFDVNRALDLRTPATD